MDQFRSVFDVIFYLKWYSYMAFSDGQIYERANSAYDALSKLLGEKNYLFGNR